VSLVVLMSGGMDSTLVAALAVEEGVAVYPVFVDYGQHAASREWAACRRVSRDLRTNPAKRAALAGYGRLVPSGLTSRERDLVADAFLPGRNMLFLTVAAGYAASIGISSVGIGLLSEETHLFPDQTSGFVSSAQNTLSLALGRDFTVFAPLLQWSKQAVVEALQARGISGTYSCHAGDSTPCGRCIACKEVSSAQER